jgi:hypothetical protein
MLEPAQVQLDEHTDPDLIDCDEFGVVSHNPALNTSKSWVRSYLISWSVWAKFNPFNENSGSTVCSITLSL